MFVLTNTNSIANSFISELRDINVQKDALRFRRNIERLGEVIAYEMSKELSYEKVEIQTPLAIKKQHLIKNQPVICTILRAGLPFYNGFINYFDKADSSFIGAWREEGEEIKVELSYVASPDLSQRDLIIVDPMLATGQSLVKAVNAVKKFGKPNQIFVASVIGTETGINYIKSQIPEVKLFICDVDEKLDENSYIVPGLGDAGDLAFGKKI